MMTASLGAGDVFFLQCLLPSYQRELLKTVIYVTDSDTLVLSNSGNYVYITLYTNFHTFDKFQAVSRYVTKLPM